MELESNYTINTNTVVLLTLHRNVNIHIVQGMFNEEGGEKISS